MLVYAEGMQLEGLPTTKVGELLSNFDRKQQHEVLRALQACMPGFIHSCNQASCNQASHSQSQVALLAASSRCSVWP